MAIPPFPSHDLAKLVLGYLAEEQLMTAYDEFLQASPYLDVFRNEYDRIFMTSLKSILAEYRAVKIYVETCKPFLLRKKIFQCSNLLEVVKFLVNHVDINRLHAQEQSSEKLRQTSYSKSNGCEVCNSLSLCACECRPRAGKSAAMLHPTNHIEPNTAQASIETTSLADLPGNSIMRRNSNRELATEVAHLQNYPAQEISQSSPVQSTSRSSVEQISQSGLVQQISQSSPAPQISQRSSVRHILQGPVYQQVAYVAAKDPDVPSSTCVKPQISSLPNIENRSSVASIRQDTSMPKSDEAKQKIEEFNTIFDLVCSNKTCTNLPRRNNAVQPINKPICSAGSFQEFATGVAGNSDSEKPTVPDSSTSENFSSQTSSLKENRKSATPITNIKGPPVGQYFLRTGAIHSPYLQIKQNLNTVPKNQFIRIKEKPDDQKVTILSDVKVDTYKGTCYVKMPQVLRASTSNSTMQMQTIRINGTPAFTNKRQMGSSFTYTKDEIMAMPTIIVVPSSGLTQSSAATYSQSNFSSSTNTTTTTTTSTPRVLEPLVIDVPSNSPPKKSLPEPDLCSENPTKEVSEGLVKTVDVTAASLPKDSNIAVPNKTNTPNAAPPLRKSSSTPRRNSHVRVLDFATPRRILHETVNENDPNQLSTESRANDNGIIPNGPSDMPVHTNLVIDDNYDKADFNKNKNKSSKENKTKSVKKSNWDAALRALVVKEPYEESVATPKPKPKKTKKKKKKVSPVTEHDPESSEADNTKTTNSTSHASVRSNESIKSTENIEQPIKAVKSSSSVLETTNKITECDASANEFHTTNKSQIKVNTSDERVETPESERFALQNAIGTKLNISDLLETPYKQFLYDIQMETPKFLGSDLPDEPISDIKVMSIPTPLFLNTPKPLQATPSSYASRPTDYSSGSSYYKPDDHDYIPPSEVLQGPRTITAVKSTNTVKSFNEEAVPIKSKEKDKSTKSTRPQRKCTKNVSYRSPNVCKSKTDESFEVASVSSEVSNKSAKDKKANKSVDSKARLKSKPKSDKKTKIVYKSPLRPKSFMKIKPRRCTPVKEPSDKGRKKTSDLTENCSPKPRKRTTSKDKSTNITSTEAAAPTKSRRKSSTPRKLNCTKPFTAEKVVQNPCVIATGEQDMQKQKNVCHQQDSDTEQLALRWSDDGSQDAKPKTKEEQLTPSSIRDEDDINKIKEYIETSAPPILVPDINSEGSLQNDLIKRGFDAETAKIIERDLLDATPIRDTVQPTSIEEKKLEISLAVRDRLESDSSTINKMHIQEDELSDEEIVLSAHDCNEDSENFFSCQFDETTFIPSKNLSKLKDKFSMELCMDDDLTIRLRANNFMSLFDMNPEESQGSYDHMDTEDAVDSISNTDKLYTPVKGVRDQCYEIFDSTLTSIDTPLKSEVTYETKVTDIVLEVEREDIKERTESKKRKRPQSGGSLEESLNKKPKPDAQYLLKSANIQNIDIESVLSKLHGP